MGDELGAVVLPILAANTHRLASLHLEIEFDCGAVEALTQVAAPVLEDLKLHFDRMHDPPSILPLMIFAGHAPKPAKVSLSRVALLPNETYPAFAAVTTVHCSLRSTQSKFPGYVLSCFPAMQTLFIRSIHLKPSETLLPNVCALPLRRLEIHTHLLSAVLPLLGWLDAERLPEVWLLVSNEDAIPHLVQHLQPPLRVREYGGLVSSWKDWGEYITVESLADGKTRVFEMFMAPELYKFLFTDLDGGALVRELSLAFDDAPDIFAHVEMFPAVRVLRLEMPPGNYAHAAENEDGPLVPDDNEGTLAARRVCTP